MKNMTRRQNLGQVALVLLSVLELSSCAESKNNLVFLGLKPIDPVSNYGMDVVHWSSLNPSLYWQMTDCALLPSRQPTLRWLAFATGSTPGISDVTYELRIWEAVHEAPGKLVYAREGLSDPSHAVQEPLTTPGSYFWSIRARFLLNGMPRVTDWGQQLWGRTTEHKPDRLTTHEYYQYYCFRTGG